MVNIYFFNGLSAAGVVKMCTLQYSISHYVVIKLHAAAVCRTFVLLAIQVTNGLKIKKKTIMSRYLTTMYIAKCILYVYLYHIHYRL